MPSCKFIKRKHRKICVGDLDTLIKLQGRQIVSPVFGEVDFNEDFQDTSEVWALVETQSGKTIFDGINADVNITHKITIRFDPLVTAETWIELNSIKIDIVLTENLEARDEWLLLLCTLRGIGEAAKA